MNLTQTRLKDGSDFKPPTANELVKYSTNLANLKELGLSDNLMEVPMSVLVQAIPKLTILKLQYIFFSDKFKMTKNVLEEVFKAVTKWKCLKNLYIIGDDDESSAGVSPKLFADAVSGLTNVYFGGIGLTAPQVTEILQASLLSKTLKKLTLQFSDIFILREVPDELKKLFLEKEGTKEIRIIIDPNPEPFIKRPK